jgi:hypothetical protein
MIVALNALMRVIIIVPQLLKQVLAEVPDALASFICDLLRSQGFDDVCPL